MTDALELMNIVTQAVKAGESGTGLLDAINTLCTHLKTYGQQIEQTNKVALDNVFVSLRQAACRDAGQLGKAVRLRMMQLIELRAMKWRPSLSHSAYYSKHTDAPSSSYTTTPTLSPPPPTVPSASSPTAQPLMPHQIFPMPLLPPHLRSPQLVPHSDLPIPIPSPTFYLLPALANMGILPFLGPHPHLERMLQQKKPAKPVLREEIMIRNADSGKLMGVKGRRVALVEQISGSVISFQKVTDPKSKQRTLTITASDQESIEKAKSLIEDTIRRNASPVCDERIPVEDAIYSREQIMAFSNTTVPLAAKADILKIAPEILRGA